MYLSNLQRKIIDFISSPKDLHSSIEGYTISVYNKFGVKSPDDLDHSRYMFLQLINHPGKIIDLGCGCGWFLKYLVERSVHKLEPFGVDIDAESIREAQEIVFPEYKDNFSCSDIQDIVLDSKFDYIIVNPLYLGVDFAKHYEKLWNSISDRGMMILMITTDTLERMTNWKGLWRFLKKKNLSWVQTNLLTHGYVTKNCVREEKDLRNSIRVSELLNS